MLITAYLYCCTTTAKSQCPEAEFPTSTSCYGDSVCLPNNSYDSCNNIVESRWYFYSDSCQTVEDSVILDGIEDVCYRFKSTGVNCVKLVVVNDASPPKTDTRYRFSTVFNRPSATASDDTTICPGDTTSLNVVVTGGTPSYNFTWRPNRSLNDSTIKNPKAYPDTTTKYVCTIRDQNNCPIKDSVRIRVSNPGTDAGPDLTVCNGDSAILGGFLGDTTNFKYTWRPSFQLNDSTLANPTAHITTDTTYTLKMVDQDRGCVRRDTMQVQTGPTEAIAFPDSLKFCSGGTERLYAAGGTRFTWQPDKFLDCNNCRTTLTTPTDSINYNVIVNSGSCQDTTNIHVEVHPLPRVDAGTDSFLLCSPDTITLGGAPTVTGGSKPYSIQWFPLAGLNNPTDSQPKAYPDQGKQYNLTVTDNNGCQAFDSTVVLVSAAPPAQAPPDTQIYIGQYIRLSTPEGGYNYQWQPDASLDSPSIASPLARPLENTTYTVTVDSNNCTSTSAITIKVTDKFDIFVPDAFTPNGDGINDRLIIRGVGIAKVIKFQIYNRWGRPVYTAQSVSKAMQKGWDGRHNGTPVSAGNYTYHLIVEDFDGNRTTKSGAISIIR